MKITFNARVLCRDGEGGYITHIVIQPHQNTLISIVIDESNFGGVQFVVPIEYVRENLTDSIQLNCTRNELNTMKPFTQYEYLQGRTPIYTYAPTQSSMESYALPESGFIPFEHENIPTGAVAVRSGAHVKAIDGRVGQVKGFVVTPQDYHATHLILIRRHIWQQTERTIPISEVAGIEENAVYLKGDKTSIERLPTTQ